VPLRLFKTHLALDVHGELRFAWCAVYAPRPSAAPTEAMRLLRGINEFADAVLVNGITYTRPISGWQGVLRGRRGRRA